MPPKPFPWDRRDFRKHERSGTDPRFGGGCGVGGPPRWREHHHPNAPPPYPPPYHHHQQQPRRYVDFRSRPLPPGHGKQNGWRMHPDEAYHGLPSYGPRLSDRNMGEENYRSFGPYGDGGRHFRNNRENRGSFNQKYWRATSWEPVSSPNVPGRGDETNDERLMDHSQAGANNNNESNNSPHIPPDSVDMSENPLSTVEDKQVQDAGMAEELTSAVKAEKESYTGSIDWKPLKWSRSGSLSSRGASLSWSSSSKSLGVDSIETVPEVLEKTVIPIQSPTLDAPADVVTDNPTPSEENSSRKKPRLGWGDGLAKYEKKKIDGPEEDPRKNSLFVRVGTLEETVQSDVMSLVYKSPRIAGVLDGESPATPSSVAFSSSPGIEEKGFSKAANIEQDASNFSSSPSIMSHTPYDGLPFDLENLELSFFASLSPLIGELLQSNDPSSGDTHHVGVGVNKVLLWKGELTKALEKTEFEIDSLETEHELLTSEPRSRCQFPDLSSTQQEDFCLKFFEGQVTASDSTLMPCPSYILSPGDMNVENAPRIVGDEHAMLKNESINSPCCETSNCVEMPPSREDLLPPQAVKYLVNLDDVNISSNSNEKGVDKCHCNGRNNQHTGYHELTGASSCQDLASDSGIHCYELDFCGSMLASNKDVASGASDTLNKLLFSEQHSFDVPLKSDVSYLQSHPSDIKMRFSRMKRFLRFKEKALTIKYKLFKHFWRQDRIVCVRKLRETSLKKFDLIGFKKHRYSRARISFSAGNSRTVSAEDLIDVAGSLLSDSSFKSYRNNLKMPALILDKKEMQMSRFVSNNGVVEDVYAFEKDRSAINSWTPEETEIFIDKFASFRKDFKKIASFLDQKTTADCVEFYYKNHKSDCFGNIRKVIKQNKPQSTQYLVASGKRRSYEDAAASLDMLGAASEIVAAVNAGVEIHEKSTPNFFSVAANTYKTPRFYDSQLKTSNSLDLSNNEREVVAADVLAGICGSLSSEAVSSSITSSVDHGDGYHDWRCQRVSLSSKPPFTSEVTHSVDDECSDDSCEELDATDWSDAERSIFIQALSSNGKDFGMISRCVRTRSRDQCRVFYSKARKCLRLDEIHLGVAVSGDANGGDSDVEDACVLETGMVISNEGSNCKMDDHFPHPHMTLGHEVDITEVTCLLNPDKGSVEHSSLDSLDPMGTKPVSKNLLTGNCQCDDKQNLDFNMVSSDQNGTDGLCVSVQELGTMSVSPNIETVLRDEAANEYALTNGSIEPVSNDFVEVSGVYHSKESREPKKFSPTTKVECVLHNSSDISGVNCTAIVKSASHPSLTEQDVSECQMRTEIEFPSPDKSLVVSLQHNDHIASLRSSTLFTVPIKYQKLISCSTSSPVSAIGVDDHFRKTVRSDGYKSNGHPLSELVESSQIVRGYPLAVPIVSEVMNSCLDCGPVQLQNIPSSDGKLHSDCQLKFSLRNYNSSRHDGEVEVSHPLQEQETIDQSRSLQPDCSSSVVKLSRTCDVKLFGKILTSSQEKSCSRGQRKDDNSSQNHKSGCPSPNLKFSEHFNSDSGASRFDCNKSVIPENIPVKNFSLWDGKRMPAGLPPMLDSPILLAKYPTAFNNYARPSAKVELPAPHGVVNNNNHSLNGVMVCPSRELCSGNGVADYIRNREVAPFTLDMKNPREIFFSEMQRKNVFDVVTEMQHQSRGIVGSGGTLVPGPCSGVSDPVAAIRMHYAKAERFSLPAGNIIKEEDTWRNKADIGRL